MSKKIESILSLIEVAENNIVVARKLLIQIAQEKNTKNPADISFAPVLPKSREEEEALEVVEGYFDGENMIGDNSQTYPVPQNYASKTQLIIGDRMKWILTPTREIFKLIAPANRVRVTGSFNIEGDNFVALVDEYSNPVKILKASSTYAMKNLGLRVGDEIAIYVPKDATPVWGAFISVVKPGESQKTQQPRISTDAPEELDNLDELKLNEAPNKEDDFF